MPKKGKKKGSGSVQQMLASILVGGAKKRFSKKYGGGGGRPKKKKKYGKKKRKGIMSRFPGAMATAAMNYLAPGISPFMGMMSGEIKGSGDYKVSMNSLIGSGPVPNFGSNEIRVKHREYLGPLNGTTAFTNTSYPINPGIDTTFPWLSQLAANYEQYKMHGLIFEYVTTSATAVSSTNTALGQVVMATDYDALDASFISSRQMLASLYSNYGVPCTGLTHAVECATRKSFSDVLYVRQGAPPASSDLRLYDVGNFQIATEGMQSGVTQIGGLWVSYDVTFMKPVLQDASTDSQSTLVLSSVSGTTGAFSSTAPIYGNLPINYSVTSSNSTANLFFPQTNVGDVLLINLSTGANTNSMSFSVSTAFNILNNTNLYAGGALSSVQINRIGPSTASPDVVWQATRSGTSAWSSALICTTLSAASQSWPWGTVPLPEPPKKLERVVLKPPIRHGFPFHVPKRSEDEKREEEHIECKQEASDELRDCEPVTDAGIAPLDVEPWMLVRPIPDAKRILSYNTRKLLPLRDRPAPVTLAEELWDALEPAADRATLDTQIQHLVRCRQADDDAPKLASARSRSRESKP